MNSRTLPPFARSTLKACLVWMPFGVLWAIFIIVYAGSSIVTAALSGILNAGMAGILGLAVWHGTARFGWPGRIDLGLIAGHMAAGAAFSGIWATGALSVAALLNGENPARAFESTAVVYWRLLLGAWIYGCVVGVSYAVHNFRRLEGEKVKSAQAQEAAYQAKLDLVRSQINHHFLFNALHSIGALVQADAPRAEAAIEQLGDLLRYSLDRDNARAVTLNEEMEFVRNYANLQNLKLENPARLEFDIAPGALLAMVPPMTIQALVENTFTHAGFEDREHNWILVKASLDGPVLVIEVTDNGDSQAANRNQPASGLGLSMLRDRLRLAFGDGATVVTAGPEAGGHTTRVTLPLGNTRCPGKNG